MFVLHMKLYALILFLFAILYAVATVIGQAMGITSFYFYVVLTGIFFLIQYLLGPKLVELQMKVKYVSEEEAPELHRMIAELAQKAGIPKPRVGISPASIPNAFAFGRLVSDSRVCVTRGIMHLLNRDELKAVLGHEISHIKNRDVLFITFLSVIPILLYRLAFHFLFFGSYGRRRNSGQTALVGLAALVFYFVTNLLVLYASRIREYFADRGSISLGNTPAVMATALYKLVYGSARLRKESLRETEGLKAFFVNDPSRARTEIRELQELDLDRSGTIDPYELDHLRAQQVKLKTSDMMMELFSTHPNMLKRIKHLSLLSG
ncbi:MAG: M48 family metalloprotease [Elusimicrobia bacterium]|nr:M48 family metalloprotease [Elusimicrobiota bacterium]MBD3412031.1 M48 family metalloprotease [Elusimicrobiota bacterium]